jgi:hypothetical protein
MLLVLLWEVFNLLKKLLISFLIYFAAFFASATVVSAAVTGGCEVDTNGSIIISAAGLAGNQVQETNGNQKAPFNYANGYVDDEFNDNDTDACQTQPLFYKIDFYKVALCTADPYTQNADPDYSSCSDIFNNAGGKSIEIEPDVDVDLLEGDLFLPVGSYPYLAVITSNHIQIKHKQKYVHANGDSPEMHGNGDTAGALVDTDTCYTIAVVTTYTGAFEGGAGDFDHDDGYDAAHGVTTVASAGTAGASRIECIKSGDPDTGYDYATEIIDHFGDDKNLVPNIAYSSMLATTGVDVDLAGTMLQDDNTSVATTPTNALRLASHFRYTTPVLISENTVGFKLNFATTRGVSLDAAQNGASHIYMVKVGADPFTIEVQTKTKRRRGSWR